MTAMITDRGQQTVMYRNGSVYSPADPFATAVLVHNDRVAWVGEETGADSLIDPTMVTVDLDGLILVPGFVGRVAEGDESADTDEVLARAGYTAGVVFTDRGVSLRSIYTNDSHDLPDTVRVASPGEEFVGTEDHGLLLAASLEDEAWIDIVKEQLKLGTAIGLVGDTSIVGAPETPNPWAWATKALRLDSQESIGLPTRATFTAQTRGLKRLFRAGGPFGGQIVPDAPVDFVGWRAEALMVQTADSRIAAWSTDPRARTPLLPELSDTSYPEARLARVGSRELSWS